MTGLPQVTINISAFSRPALSDDGIAGFILYNNDIADLTVFSTTSRVQRFTNFAAIEATGINSTSVNFTDEADILEQFFLYGGGEVYIGVFDVPIAAYDFVEVDAMKASSDGAIKLYAVPAGIKALASADVLTLDAKIATLNPLKKSATSFYSANTGAITVAALEDMRALSSSAKYVSVVLGQDLDNYPATITTYSMANIGAVVGRTALLSVNENSLYSRGINRSSWSISTNMINVGIVLNDGTTDNTFIPISDIAEADQDDINDRGYIFWRYLPNKNGSILSNDNNCAFATEAFNSIHAVRTDNKIRRVVDSSVSDLLGATVAFNPDGTMRQASINEYFKATNTPLSQMESDGEISAYTIFIDPTQDVLTTKTVIIQVAVLLTETSDYITVNIDYPVTLA